MIFFFIIEKRTLGLQLYLYNTRNLNSNVAVEPKKANAI